MSLSEFIQRNCGSCLRCNFEYELLEAKDLSFFVETRNLVRNYLHNSKMFSLDDAKIWFSSPKVDRYVLVTNLLSFQKIGYFRLKLINSSNLQIGLDLHPNYQAKGLGFELYRCLINHWDKLDEIRTLSLYVLSYNTRAINLYLKLGFKIKSKVQLKKDDDLFENIYMELNV